MKRQVKICGLSTPDTVQAAVDGGAAFLGLNFFEKSPRYVSPDTAARLAALARRDGPRRPPSIVAITVDADDAEIDRIVAALNPDFVQLHGKETPARAQAISARTGVRLIRALAVSEQSDIEAAARWDGVVDHLLFDARPPAGSALPGGTGARFDWTLLAGHRFRRPHFLAGGLDPWNVGEALRLSGAPLADVSSGVERGPGIKDGPLITAFLDAVRSL
ncbi:MAG: phosphoribosylanthranilate isomerase [Caulobacteraceae bacterium]|nr:phosphoribosylanthranilate isomerase [Caulobacteraceae bacterium]